MARKPANGSLDLTSVIAGMLQAVKDAKQRGDIESVKLAELYAKDARLSAFRPPRFALQEVELELRFVIDLIPAAGRKSSPEVRVIVDGEALKAMGSERLQTLRVRISPPDRSL